MAAGREPSGTGTTQSIFHLVSLHTSWQDLTRCFTQGRLKDAVACNRAYQPLSLLTTICKKDAQDGEALRPAPAPYMMMLERFQMR